MKALIMRQRYIVATLLITAVSGVAASALALRDILTTDHPAKREDAERSLVPGPHAFR